MLQNLKIFKGKSEPVTAAAEAAPVAATPEADAKIVQRGTVQDLKHVAGPSKDDIEADFAFMSDILNKAGVSEPVRQTAAVAPKAAPQNAPRPKSRAKTISKPTFEPIHKRGANASGGPMFKVQDGPRSLTPSFLQTEEDDALDEDLEFDVADEEESEEMTDALRILELRPAAAQTAPVSEPAPVVEQVAQAPSPTPAPEQAPALNEYEEDLAAMLADEQGVDMKPPARKTRSFFGSKKAVEKKSTPEADQELAVGIEPPKMLSRLMTLLPSSEIPQGVSDFAKARLARDPFDRLLDERARA